MFALAIGRDIPRARGRGLALPVAPILAAGRDCALGLRRRLVLLVLWFLVVLVAAPLRTRSMVVSRLLLLSHLLLLPLARLPSRLPLMLHALV